MKHEYSTIAIIGLITIMIIGAIAAGLSSSEIDELCNTDGTVLYRDSGTWTCGTIASNGEDPRFTNLTSGGINYTNSPANYKGGYYFKVGTSTSTGFFITVNSSEPTLSIENTGGAGGATFQFKDNKSYSFWKFKAVTSGGFKIRDQNYAYDIMVIENNASANMIYIDSDDYVGIKTNAPTFPLEVRGNTSGVTIWSEANISATGYNTRTSIYDKLEGRALNRIRDALEYRYANGSINHTAYYGYAGMVNVTDYERPVIIMVENDDGTGLTEVTTYPYKKEIAQVSMEKEMDAMRQALHDIDYCMATRLTYNGFRQCVQNGENY